MKKPYGDPEVHGFEALTPAVFRHAENAEGFVNRAREIDDRSELTNFERDWGEWGPFTVPSFYDGGFTTATDTRASTLSLWRSIEDVKAFVYNGLHQRALAQRHKWFRTPNWPGYAMWWVEDAHIPKWSEAASRLEYLFTHGPTPFAFTFPEAFDAYGVAIAKINFLPPGAPQTIDNESQPT
ncbi:DUF3291 domain-containing protein [Agrobacterium vitis]|nr:DUF3291 domain-containing protein [Agrobacterium vitis]